MIPGVGDKSLSKDSSKEIGYKMSDNEIRDIVKAKNNQIIQNTCLKIAHLMKWNQLMAKLDPYTPFDLKMTKVSA